MQGEQHIYLARIGLSYRAVGILQFAKIVGIGLVLIASTTALYSLVRPGYSLGKMASGFFGSSAIAS
jgi:hypothetical protein